MNTTSPSPVANNGTQTVGWVNEPDGRGTFSILRSCLITLVLCVYTSLHLNVYPRNTKWHQMVGTKLKWVVIGCFAPEIVVYFAYCQRQSAMSLNRRLNAIFDAQEAKDPKAKRKYKWTMTHSFYAIMGGFAFETDDGPLEPAYIPGSPTLFLYPPGVKAVADLGLLPDISRGFIRDKSKADSFAKVVVITQASWMILQCIMRKAVGLKLTALELNTLAHAVCALMIYGLWWEKPLDIQEPYIIQGEWRRQLAATFAITSKLRKNRRPYFAGMGSRREHPELETIEWDETKTLNGFFATNHLAIRLRNPGDNGDRARFPLKELADRDQEPEKLLATLERHEILTPLGICPNPESRRFHPRRRKPFTDKTSLPTQVEIDHTTLVRWSLFRSALHDHGSSLIDAMDNLTDDTLQKRWPWLMASTGGITKGDGFARLNPYWLRQIKCLADEEVTNYYNDMMEEGVQKVILGEIVFFIFCAAAYGGVHIAAWNSYFPSPIEALLWRISAVTVAGVGVPAFALIMWLYLDADDAISTPYREWRKQVLKSAPMSGLTKMIFDMSETGAIMGVFGWSVAIGLFYLFARTYLVVEAFVSLRKLPVAAYTTPEWTQYLPHF